MTLFGTTTDLYSNLGAVSQATFNDIWPYLLIVIGIPLAFFIIEMLIDLIPHKQDHAIARADAAIAEFERLHKEGKV